jgi:hypothetical protein
MQIAIQNSDQFHRLLFALVDELVDAQIHFNLYQDLVAAIPEYSTEFNQSNTFWSLTFSAHLDATVLRLCKAYDQYGSDKPSLNLTSLLDTIDANLHLFDEPNFRERLKENPFVDSLAETNRRPDPVRLKQDKLSVSNSDPLVKKLTIWRNNFLAHRNPKHALDAKAFVGKYPLLISEIGTLLANGVAIVNRYSSLFVATSHSTGIVGRDDYLWLLKAARKDLDAHEAQIQEDINKIAHAAPTSQVPPSAVRLRENSSDSETRKQQEFFHLAECFRNATDPTEAKRLGDELGRMVFGT